MIVAKIDVGGGQVIRLIRNGRLLILDRGIRLRGADKKKRWKSYGAVPFKDHLAATIADLLRSGAARAE